MQKRIWILLIVGGLMASIATGWMIISSGDEAAPNPVNITVNDGTKKPATQNQASDQTPSKTQNETLSESQGEIIEQAEGQVEEAPEEKSEEASESAKQADDTAGDTKTAQTDPIETDTAQTDIEPEQQEAAPAAQPAADDTDISPVFAITVARVNPDGSAVFAGVAEPGATIQLQNGDILIDETIADANGEWVSLPAEKLAPGSHLIMLTMRTKDGRIARADTSLVVEIADTLDEKPLVALVPQTDDAAPALLQSPDSDAVIEVANEEVQEILIPASDPVVSIQSLAFLSETALQVRGQYAAGNKLIGSLADIELRDVSLSQNGSWTAVVDISGLGTEPQLLHIDLLDQNDKLVASTEMMLDRANLAAGLDGSDLVVVQRGDALWRIAYRSYGQGVRYVEIFRRNRDQISDPDLIYPNQIFVVPK